MTRIDCAAASCSAWASRSAATNSRIGGSIGEDHDLGRSGDHIDADDAEHPALGGRDIGVARTDDLGDRRDGRRPIGQRGHGLRAADPVDLVDPSDARRRQHQRVDPPLRRRHDHRHAAASGDLRRDRVHHDRGRIARRAAGHIEADRLDRPPAPAELDPERVGEAQIGRLLALVVGRHAGVGEFKRLQRLGVAVGQRCVDLRRADLDPGRRDVDPVEPQGIVDERCVAARAHVVDDGADGGVDVRRLLPLGAEQRREALLETGGRHVEFRGHLTPTPARTARGRRNSRPAREAPDRKARPRRIRPRGERGRRRRRRGRSCPPGGRSSGTSPPTG